MGGLGTAACNNNSTYSGGRDLEDLGSRIAQAMSYQDHITTNKPGGVENFYNPSYWDA
jgi:hypothetical protein